jgi:hypothetical protein
MAETETVPDGKKQIRVEEGGNEERKKRGVERMLKLFLT